MKNTILSFHDALDALLNDNQTLVEQQLLPISRACNTIVAKPIIAPFDIPAFDNSAMDGIALNYNDFKPNATLNVMGTILAGQDSTDELISAECVKIMTGSPLLRHHNTVIMKESLRFEQTQAGELVTLPEHASIYDNVRLKGEEIQAGQVIFQCGHRFKNTDLGLLATLGIDKVCVYTPLKVAIFSTGNEIVEPGALREENQIFDANRYSLIAILKASGFEVIDCKIVPDSLCSLTEAFNYAIKHSDVVISSGGVSMGEADHVKNVLSTLGHTQFWKVAMKPGKPFAYGHLNSNNSVSKVRFFGLPGNPVSSIVTLEQLVLPTLKKMAGEAVNSPKTFYFTLSQPVSNRSGRLDFVRAKVDIIEQKQFVTPCAQQGSAMLSSFTDSDGYILLNPAKVHWEKGDIVPFIFFNKALI